MSKGWNNNLNTFQIKNILLQALINNFFLKLIINRSLAEKTTTFNTDSQMFY